MLPWSIIARSEKLRFRSALQDLTIGIALSAHYSNDFMSVLPLPWQYVSSTYSITASFVKYYRFSIYEDCGCSIELMDTWVAIVITSAGPRAPVTGPLGIYFGVYGCLGIHAFQKHRSHRNEFLSSREDRNRSNQYIIYKAHVFFRIRPSTYRCPHHSIISVLRDCLDTCFPWLKIRASPLITDCPGARRCVACRYDA